MTPELSLRVETITVRRRGRRLLGPVSAEFPAEGFTILLGPNGSGKTTFLKAMHGIERLAEGQLHWSIADEDARDRQAYVFQTPTMLRRTVAENLAYPLKLAGVKGAEQRDLVARWAGRIGLAAALGRSATRLSGGERQKLALARALIRAPGWLFLDEPCANLDGRATREIEALLRDAQSQGTRMIMATHDLGQARRLASDVLFMLDGKILEHSPADRFFAAPQTPQAAAFLKGDIVE